jgi:chromo domain-containing protein 1
MTIPARGHMSPHADTDLDADDVSITSTVEGQPDGDTVYAVDEILAEKWDVWDHDPDQPVFRGIKYLTKWEGYPLHE